MWRFTSSNDVLRITIILFLYSLFQGVQQGAASLGKLLKQLEAGTSAVELLKTALTPGPPSDGRPGLLPSPPGAGHSPPGAGHSPAGAGASELSGLISTMTNLVSAGKLPSQPPATVTPNTKNPQLMNMLYSAFQVSVG